jgi:hypothetical protein
VCVDHFDAVRQIQLWRQLYYGADARFMQEKKPARPPAGGLIQVMHSQLEALPV